LEFGHEEYERLTIMPGETQKAGKYLFVASGVVDQVPPISLRNAKMRRMVFAKGFSPPLIGFFARL
jgi:hypothetical protein